MRRTFVVVALLLFISGSFASDSTKDFRKILSSKGYFGSGAGESWPYAGGFLVMMKSGGNPTFTDLPPEMTKPSSEDETVDFPSVDQTKSFSLKVVLTGLQAIIGGNPGIGFGHTSTMNFTELKAQGKRITYDQANKLVNSQTMPQIQEWMKMGHRVFVVGIALSTKSITVTTDSKWNIDATFNGSAASDCSSTDNKNNSNDKPNSTPNPTSPQANVNVSRVALKGDPRFSFASSFSPQNSSNSQQGGATNSNSPGGELHVCKESKNSLKMNSDNPLVFALGAYEVIQKTPDGLPFLEPVMSVPKNSGPFNLIEGDPSGQGPEMTRPKVALANSVKPHWERQAWPTNAHH